MQWADGGSGQPDNQGIALPQFKARHLRLYLADRAQSKISEATRRHDAIAARTFFAFCKDEGYIDENPLSNYKVAKPARPYVKCPSDEEITALFKAGNRPLTRCSVCTTIRTA